MERRHVEAGRRAQVQTCIDQLCVRRDIAEADGDPFQAYAIQREIEALKTLR